MTVDANSFNSMMADANVSSLNLVQQPMHYAMSTLALSTLWFILIAHSMRLRILDFTSDGWIHGFAIVCTFMFLIPSRPLWVAGSLAVFFAWFRLAVGLLFFDVFGLYISMFLAIARTV